MRPTLRSHHEGQPTIAFQREPKVEINNNVPLPEPVIARNEDVVFVGLTVTISPLVILRAREFHPVHQALISVRA